MARTILKYFWTICPSGCRPRICRSREAANRRGDREAPGVNVGLHPNPPRVSLANDVRRSGLPVRV